MIAGTIFLTTILSIPFQSYTIKDNTDYVNVNYSNLMETSGNYITNKKLSDKTETLFIEEKPVVKQKTTVVKNNTNIIDMRVIPSKILTTKINSYRVNQLYESQLLNELACTRAKYLYDNQQWSHDNFLMSFYQFDYKNKYCGENLGRKWKGNYKGLVTEWSQSNIHYREMVKPQYNYHGWCDYNDYVVSLFTD